MRRLGAAVVLLGLALAGCADPDSQPSPPESAAPPPTTSTSSTSGTAAADPSTSTTPVTSPSTSPSTPPSTTAPGGGTSDAPTPVTAATDLLTWKAAPGDVQESVTTNGTWTLTVSRDGTSYDLESPGQSLGSSGAGPHLRIGDVLMDHDWAVVVFQDRRENGTSPDRAEVTDLATGKQFDLDAHSEVPTTTGGTWSLGADTVVHATVSAQGDYCLATVSLESGAQTRGYCAEPRHGFTSAHVTSAGTTLLTFDDHHPSCRTVGTVSGTTFTPLPGVADCVAWEGVLLGPDSAVWSVIPKENQIERAEFQARVGDGYFDLGPGTSGTLVACHGAAYFTRDPQRDGQPAALMRWDGQTLAVVYQSPPGQSFLQAPRCGDDAITVTALSEGGDQQVTAALD